MMTDEARVARIEEIGRLRRALLREQWSLMRASGVEAKMPVSRAKRKKVRLGVRRLF